jgi:aminoglycoside phosphotransferase (APT) family kinase protein
MATASSEPPYRRVLEDVVAEVVPNGSVRRVRRLGGGLASLMHAVDVEVRGTRVPLTLRRCRPDRGHDAAIARKEWEVLAHLHGIGMPVPEPLWLDADGERFGIPAMLLRRLPGRPVLAPGDIAAWARGLAVALARVHAVDVTPVVPLLPSETHQQRQLRYLHDEVSDAELLTPTVDARAMIAGIRGRIDGATRRLIHGDYHAGNVLWSGGRVTGVIDWTGARLGDPRFDIAYLRLDCALLLGDPGADAVLAAYTDATSADVVDLPVWDTLAATAALPDPTAWLPGYVALGRSDLDATLVVERYQRFVDRSLAQIDDSGRRRADGLEALASPEGGSDHEAGDEDGAGGEPDHDERGDVHGGTPQKDGSVMPRFD